MKKQVSTDPRIVEHEEAFGDNSCVSEKQNETHVQTSHRDVGDEKPLPEIISRPTAHAHPAKVQIAHPAKTQIFAPFATSPRPYLGGEVCYAAVAAITPGDIVKPVPTTTANRADKGGEILSATFCSSQASLLSKVDFSYPTGAHTAMSAPARRATLGGAVEGEGVPLAGVAKKAQDGSSKSWSLSPNREKRRPLKPLHSSGATALARASSNPSLGLPSSSPPPSTFPHKHKLRPRLQGPLKEGGGVGIQDPLQERGGFGVQGPLKERGGRGGQVQRAGAHATGPGAAAAAAAAIAAMVSSSSESDDALTRPTFLGRGVPLLEGSSPGSHPSAIRDQRSLREGQSSAAAPDKGIVINRSISWSPFSSGFGSSGGGGGDSSSSAVHTTVPARPNAAPRLRRGSSLTYFTSQVDAPYRNNSERRPPGGGTHSPPPGKVPVAPILRRASTSSIISPTFDRVRLPRRSPSLRGTSDADQKGQSAMRGALDADREGSQSVHNDTQACTSVLRSGSRGSDGDRPPGNIIHGALPPPLLGIASSLGSSQPPTMMPKYAGRGGQETPRTCDTLVERRGSRGGQGGNDRDSEDSVDRDDESGGGRDSEGGSDRDDEGGGSPGINLLLAPSHELRKQTSPQSKTCDVLGERRESQGGHGGNDRDSERGGDRDNDGGKSRDNEGSGSGGINLLAPSRDARGAIASESQGRYHLVMGGAAASNALGGSHIARRNDSILKKLFSGASPGTAGVLGEVPGAGFSFEFGLWKNTKGAPSVAMGSRGVGMEVALPPPPQQGFPQAGLVAFCPRADVDGVCAHGNRGFSGRISLEAMNTMASASGEVTMAGRPSTPPPSQTCTGLSSVEKLVANGRRNDERCLNPAGGLRGPFKTQTGLRDLFKTENGPRDIFKTQSGVSFEGDASTTSVSIAEELRGGESGHSLDATTRDGARDGTRDGTRDATRYGITDSTRDATRDGTTPPALVTRTGKPPRRRKSPLVSCTLQPPSAACSSARSRAKLSRRLESSSGLSRPPDTGSGLFHHHDSSSGRGGRGGGRGRLRGLNSTSLTRRSDRVPPPALRGGVSAARSRGGEERGQGGGGGSSSSTTSTTTMASATRPGEGKEGGQGSDGSSSSSSATSSDAGVDPAVSRGLASGGVDVGRSGNLRRVSATRRTPPLLSVTESQHHTTSELEADPDLRHGSKGDSSGGGVRLEGTRKGPGHAPEVLYINASTPETDPEYTQYGPEDSSTDHPERLSVEISEEISEELDSGARSRWSQMSAVSESYGEDSQWAADKEFHMCVSRYHRHNILWKRGEQIGMGSFGKVFKGLNESTGELFAVKQIELAHGSKEEMNTLETEIDLMKDLNHRNIVRYCGTDRGLRHLYIFLEYVPGGSIASMLQQFGVFRDDLVRRFVHQILLGMCYLHDKGIIHRDIKGANVLVTEQGIAKLADFGCSKQFQGVRTPSFDESLQAMRGSVPWMAPEMVKQTGHGRSADVWSLGATMIEMYTARYPWPHFSNNIAAMYHVATCTEPPAFPENAALDAKRFLSNCLIVQPDQRLRASELLQHPFLHGAAEELLASSGQGPGGFGSLGGMAKPKRKPHRK